MFKLDHQCNNIQMEEEYEKISCDLYDQLEIFATFKKPLLISYLDQNDEEQSMIDSIKTIKTENKAEFLITESDMSLRLDKLVSIQELKEEH